MMIGDNDGCMWVIAESVLCDFGVKLQNWEKSGKRMSSHDDEYRDRKTDSEFEPNFSTSQKYPYSSF